jgi:hypothetical protein
MPNQILELPIADLIIDETYDLAGRSKKELEENAKARKDSMAGGWRPEYPGQVFKRDGKHHLLAGFSRAHCLLNIIGDKKAVGYFVEVPDEPLSLLTACIRSNSGKDITPLRKGQIFAKLRDGDDPTKAEVGAVVREGMEVPAIAELVGCTPQLVHYCIHIFEAPEEIREILLRDEVNGNVIDKARAAARDKTTKVVNEALWVKAVKKAVQHAKANGKDKASEKDFDAIKSEVFPDAKLKAAGAPKPGKPSAPAPDPEPEEDEKEEDGPKEPKGGNGDTPGLNLGNEAPSDDKPKSGSFHKKHRKEQIDAIVTLLRKADEEFVGEADKASDGVGIGLDDDELEHLATFLVDSNVKAELSPI